MIQTKELTKLESFLPLIYDLQEETWPHDHLSRKAVLDKIIQIAQILGVNLNPDDPEFLTAVMIKIWGISFQPPKLETPSIPPHLAEFLEDYDKAKREQQEEIRKKLGAQENYNHYQKLENGLKKFIVVSTDSKIPEELAKRIAESAVDKIITSLPPVAQEEFFHEEDKKQILKEAKEIVDKEVKKVIREEVVLKKEAFNEFKKIIEAEAIKIAAEPQIIEAIKERQLVKKPPIDLKKLSLPPEIVKQIELQVIKETYSPFKTILDPQASLALTKKTFYTLQAKAIQMKVAEMQVPPEQKEAFERFKKMVYQGLFKEDLQTTSEFLKKLGLPENHPAFNYLNSEIGAFDEIQKVDIKNWLGKIVGRGDRPYVKILKNYYDYVKKTGKWQVFDKNLNVFLKLSPDVLWANKKGYSFFVKRLVDKFQFLPNLYQKTFRFITHGNYNSLGAWTQKFVYGKVLKPILIKLGKTAAGQAVKAGAKKAAGWIATKLGIKIAAGVGVAAVGAATGPPGWVVTAVLIGIDILKFIGKKLIGLIRKIVQEPEKALMAIGAGILALVFIPMPLALIAIFPLTIGGLGIVTFISAPATLGVIGGGVGGFFTAITAIPIAAPIALFVIILFSVLAGLTLFIVMVVSGAFILPSKMAEVTPTVISPYVSEYFYLTKTADPNVLDNSDLPNTEIEYTVKIEARKENKLTINSLTETTSVQATEGKTLNVTPHDFTEDLAQGNEVSLGNPLITKYKIKPPEFFNDSLITNTITAYIVVGEEKGVHQGITSSVVIIGNPPMDCPFGWPTPYGTIMQGPEGWWSHSRVYKKEAIDITVANGTPVFATHKGTVVSSFCDETGGGNIVKISGVCKGIQFTSWYMHLESYSVKTGDKVVRGQKIGVSDNTSGCRGQHDTARHLHYEFRTAPNEDSKIKMVVDNVPVNIPRGCVGIENCGNISW